MGFNTSTVNLHRPTLRLPRRSLLAAAAGAGGVIYAPRGRRVLYNERTETQSVSVKLHKDAQA